LWHGASWTFVAWGGLHGAYLAIQHAWSEAGLRMPRPVSAALTFIAVVAAWVLFRAADFPTALSMLAGMTGAQGISMPASFAALEHAAPSLVGALGMAFDGSLHGWESIPGGAPRLIGYLAVGLTVVWAAPNSQQIAHYAAAAVREPRLPSCRVAAAAGALLAFAIMGIDRVSTFLYYQF
jgi:hypothetical protein